MSLVRYPRYSAGRAVVQTQQRRQSDIRNAFRRMANARAARINMGRANSRTVSRTRQGFSSGQGITTQHDSRRIYRKRFMPRWRKRRWRRFKQKVNAIAEKDMGSRTVVMNKTISASNATSSSHCVMACYLYGQRGSATTGAQDLFLLQNNENIGNATATAGGTVDNSTKFIFQSAILDLTIANRSVRMSNIGGVPTPVAASEAKLEVDVYECVVGKHTEEAGATFATFESLLDDNSTQTKSIGGVGTEIQYFQRGVTPFDLTYSLGRWKIKILKKTKYMVPNGDTFTYQMRDPKRRTATAEDLRNQDGFNRVGWTRVVFFVAKLIPGLQLGTSDNQYQEILNIGATRKYFYKIEGFNEDRTSYITT